jgi:hypothetical protein
MGSSVFVRLTLEFIVLVCVLVAVGQLVITRLVPWLAGSLVGPLTATITALKLLLLMPQSVFVARDRQPGPFVYMYGEGVERAAKAARTGVEVLPDKMSWLRRVPRIVFVILVIGLFVLWNSFYCTEGDQCASPIAQWSAAAKAWVATGE